MKTKMIQILLGAVGSMITVLITHFANVPAEAATAAAIGVGSVSPTVVSLMAAAIQA